MTPRLPQPEEREEPPTPEAENAATCLAMALLLAFVVGLAFLVGMIFPTAFYILLLVAAFGAFFAFHYFVWGRWLSRYIRDDEDESRDDPTV